MLNDVESEVIRSWIWNDGDTHEEAPLLIVQQQIAKMPGEAGEMRNSSASRDIFAICYYMISAFECKQKLRHVNNIL